MFKAIHRLVLDKQNLLPGEEFGKEDVNLTEKDIQRLVGLGAIRELPKPEVVEEKPEVSEPEDTKEVDEPDEQPDEVVEEVDEPDEQPEEVVEEAPVKNLSAKLKGTTGKRRK